MVGADLEGLVSSHDQSGFAVLLVFEQPHITSSALLPLTGVAVELEQLGAPESPMSLATRNLYMMKFIASRTSPLSATSATRSIDLKSGQQHFQIHRV